MYTGPESVGGIPDPALLPFVLIVMGIGIVVVIGLAAWLIFGKRS
jgi:hypothetical protein